LKREVEERETYIFYNLRMALQNLVTTTIGPFLEWHVGPVFHSLVIVGLKLWYIDDIGVGTEKKSKGLRCRLDCSLLQCASYTIVFILL
jgi:hypothetical protein